MRNAASMIGLVSLLLTSFAANTSAAVEPVAASEIKHSYTPYELTVLKAASTFHKNFSKHEFAKNGAFIDDHLHWYQNGNDIEGKVAYVKGIGRFIDVFPDIRIVDLSIVVDGNTAAVRYVIYGTQRGDLKTPTGTIKATNRKIRVDGAEFQTFNASGKMTNLTTIERCDELIEELTAK